MKVLQINATYGFGSTGRNVQEMERYLQKNNHQSYVAWGSVTTEKDSEKHIYVGNWLDHKLHALLTRVTGKQGYYSKRATKKLCKKIEDIHPDIVHLHNLHSNYICLPILIEFFAKNDYPVVITLHDCWFFTGRCYHYYGNECEEWMRSCKHCVMHKKFELSCNETELLKTKETNLKKISKLGVIGVSDWITSEARKSILKNSYLIKRIYNWIDCDLFKPVEATSLRHKLMIRDHKVVLGVSQAWSSNKGLSEMIYIAEHLKDEVVVVLIGDMDKKSILPSNMISVGFVDGAEELAKYYSLADVFVNPSKMETFGKVTAEAMACGTPAIVYENTGCKELVKGNCGMVAQNGNVEDLLRCAKSVLAQGKKTFSQQCITYVKENFDMEKQLQKYCEVYEELIKS